MSGLTMQNLMEIVSGLEQSRQTSGKYELITTNATGWWLDMVDVVWKSGVSRKRRRHWFRQINAKRAMDEASEYKDSPKWIAEMMKPAWPL